MHFCPLYENTDNMNMTNLHTEGISHFCGLHSIKVFSIEYQCVVRHRNQLKKIFLPMSVTKKKKK